MIKLYSGTPGSGKSLHCASDIYHKLKFTDKIILCNFPVNLDVFRKDYSDRFIYVSDEELTPNFLIKFSEEYFAEKNYSSKQKEGHILLYIDEAQLYFNAREWQNSYKMGWTKFFTLHRHIGFDICLMTQFDRMLDRQIRSLIEYEHIHRKVSNFGTKGKILSFLMGGGMFVDVRYWYPIREKVDSSFFKYKKIYGKMYDTHGTFDRG